MRFAARQTGFMKMHTADARRTYLRRTVWMLLSLTVISLSTLYAAQTVQYPEGFRRWVHVGTGVIMPGGPLPQSEEGMHHVFANQKAIEGYSSGEFADGSVIVYELRETQRQNGVIFEGERRRVDAMIKDSRLYSSTGGWRFERFLGNQQTQNSVHDSGTSCFECHAKVAAHGFVFTQLP
jgi:Cytochrome P460